MEKKAIIQSNYTNGRTFKHKKNNRVIVAKLEDFYLLEFRAICDKGKLDERRSVHYTIKDKIVVTGIKISMEAAVSIFVGLREILIEDGIIVEK